MYKEYQQSNCNNIFAKCLLFQPLNICHANIEPSLIPGPYTTAHMTFAKTQCTGTDVMTALFLDPHPFFWGGGGGGGTKCGINI